MRPYAEYRGFDGGDADALFRIERTLCMLYTGARLTEKQREQLGDARRLLSAVMDRHEIKGKEEKAR